ncbi:DnaJ C-terminal domain-containing protein, partial [Streptomyces scabiei]|uniref:DnaJ C-terminal domain-containing protein n=1 Tax=Streptomyces scabiei TaxID=1930 RepID=UPI0038F6CAF8
RGPKDLTITAPVSFAEAALGTTITVPTLDGSVSLKVPAGTPSGRTLRVRSRGVPASSGVGDLLVTIEVVVPSALDGAQKEAVEALASALP